MMLDAEIYVDRIVDSHIQTLNASVDALLVKLFGEKVNDLWLRTLGKSHINEGEYFGRAIYDDLSVILKDIQAAHMTDKTTVDEVSEIDRFKQLVLDKDNELASEEEKLLKTSARLWTWTKIRWSRGNFGQSSKPARNPNA